MNLKSKYFTSYYGINPAYYDLAYIHYNIDVIINNDEEHSKLKNDLKTVKEYTGNLFRLYFSSIDDLFYLAIRYLYDTLNVDEFKNLMSNFSLIKNYGEIILSVMFNYYDKKNYR